MTKEKALDILSDLLNFYHDLHSCHEEESIEGEQGDLVCSHIKESEEMEKYIEKHLS